MLYLIYALFSGSQGPAKFLSLLAGLAAIWTLYFFSKKLFGKFIPAAVATSIFAFFFAIPLIEGNIANAENFMLFPGLLAGLLVFSSVQRTKDHRLVTKLLAAGLLLGISFLTKVVAVFDLSAFAVFLFLVTLDSFSFRNVLSAVKKVIPVIVGFLTPILLCLGFFLVQGTFSTFIRATLFSNVSYVNYANQFIIPQGYLILRTVAVIGVVLFFLWRRKYIAKETLFIFLWTVFSIYSSLFSGRPYTHYALVMLPSFALLCGLFFAHKKLRLISGISLLILVLFVSKSFSFYNHSFSYYTNFISFVSGQKSVSAYQSFFDHVTPRDYALAEVIESSGISQPTLFIWGDSGQIYRLTNLLPPGRFIVAYHITMTPANTQETQKALALHQPTFIIQLPHQPTIPYPLTDYKNIIMIQGATIYEHIH